VPVAVVFPGQGTQAPGMGTAWRHESSWRVVERASDALGEDLGRLLVDAPAEVLARTREAQLAVLLTSLVVWDAARAHVPDPVAYAGHSLGQVTALIAAGAIGIEDGVRFAARRAEATQAAADAHPGRMAALLGATEEVAADACAAAPHECWIANDNAPGQVVIAGTPAGVDAAVARAKDLGVRRAMPLNVGGAFHTPLMAEAHGALAAALETISLRDPSAPVVSNADARAYDDGAGWRSRLADHVTVPVRWRSSMETLARLGATTFVEVGHGSMIAGVAKRTVPEVRVVGCARPEDVANLAEVLQ
jgi:[acyl-carrier-protein] S-malonyltransferase